MGRGHISLWKRTKATEWWMDSVGCNRFICCCRLLFLPEELFLSMWIFEYRMHIHLESFPSDCCVYVCGKKARRQMESRDTSSTYILNVCGNQCSYKKGRTCIVAIFSFDSPLQTLMPKDLGGISIQSLQIELSPWERSQPHWLECIKIEASVFYGLSHRWPAWFFLQRKKRQCSHMLRICQRLAA